jgi:hypothetical protein
MKRIVINGRDRTAELLPSTGGQESRPPAPDTTPLPGLSLGRTANQTEYLTRLLTLLRTHGAVRTDIVSVPVPPGWRGRLLKPLRRLQWRELRYQHDRIAFQRNTIHHQIAAALECMREEYRGEIARLEARIEQLEAGHAARRNPPEQRP